MTRSHDNPVVTVALKGPIGHSSTNSHTPIFLPPAALISCLCRTLSPVGTGLHRAMYEDDGLIERINWWTRGNLDRIITSLVNLANACGRPWARHPCRKPVDALGPGVSTKARHIGHGQGPWDDIIGAVKRRRRQTDSAVDFAENVVVPDSPLIRQPKGDRSLVLTFIARVISLTSIGHKKRDDIILEHSQCPSCHHELLSAYHHGTQLETAVG